MYVLGLFGYSIGWQLQPIGLWQSLCMCVFNALTCIILGLGRPTGPCIYRFRCVVSILYSLHD